MENNFDFGINPAPKNSDQVRVYESTAILAYLATPYYDYSKAVLTANGAWDSHSVMIKNDSGKTIGFALITKKGDKLLAQTFIEYHTPERLWAETQEGMPYWVQAVGELSLRPKSKMIDFHGSTRVVDWIDIKEIVLTTDRPNDIRLEPFGTLVLV